MTNPAVLAFDDMLTLIENRSAALRAAAGANLDRRVPGCPGWAVRDLVSHLGAVQLFWSAAVAAGSADGPPDEDAIGSQEPHGELLTWSAAATDALVGSLRAAGADRGCWTWWGPSGAPMTAGAVARHQVQEAGVHAFDAQAAAGRAEPLPEALAADGVSEFLTVGLRTLGKWPHDPASIVLAAGDGGTWLLTLRRDETRVSLLPEAAAALAGVDVMVTASPGDLVLAMYRRHGTEHLQISGDPTVVTRLLDWPDLD
jgi:uncharacterized protein (TIGR03083 family)